MIAGFLGEYATFLLRWLHVVAAIAWIGESFYFVALDRGLRAPAQPAQGLSGESWSVHGGGFYLKQKFLPAPAELPQTLHWSKWKAYTTWLSGFALLLLVYLAAPTVWLVDPAVAALSPATAVALSLALPLGGWVVYDLLCRLCGFRDRLMGGLVAVFVLALSFAATELFSGRAAFLLVGATLGTIMSANVFFVIIPGQKRMVAALRAGAAPNPLDGQRGRQRSVHNTYFTLPVVFAMLSVHFAEAWAHPQRWWVLVAFMAAGALIRQFFVLWHGATRAWWLLGAGALLLAAPALLLAPRPTAGDPRGAVATPPAAAAAANTGGSEPPARTMAEVLSRHCVSCHSATPTLMPAAPKGTVLDTPAQAAAHALRVHQQVVALRIMPPGNLTGMREEERALVDAWYQALRAQQQQ